MSFANTPELSSNFWHPPLIFPVQESEQEPQAFTESEVVNVNNLEFDASRPILDFFIFRQERIGKEGIPFTMFKFRTMRHGAHALQDSFEKDDRGKVINDTRYTLIGKWLKKKRIDEMPQLLNIVKGEMSIVGPRPHSSKFYANFVPEEYVKSRQSVKPGILKPMMAFSDFDFGGLEYRCDEQFIADQSKHPRSNVVRYFLRAIAPQKFKRILDPALPRYSKKDFFTPRYKQPQHQE